MNLEIELDTAVKGYGYVHKAGCRDLRDPEPVGQASSLDDAEALVEAVIGWEPPFYYAPCAVTQLT